MTTDKDAFIQDVLAFLASDSGNDYGPLLAEYENGALGQYDNVDLDFDQVVIRLSQGDNATTPLSDPSTATKLFQRGTALLAGAAPITGEDARSLIEDARDDLTILIGQDIYDGVSWDDPDAAKEQVEDVVRRCQSRLERRLVGLPPEKPYQPPNLGVIVGSRYRHYKTGDTYVVLAGATNCSNGKADGTPMVVYQSSQGRVFTRSYWEFFAEATDGSKRFEPLVEEVTA